MNRIEFFKYLVLFPFTRLFPASKPKGTIIYSSYVAGFQFHEGNNILRLFSVNDPLTLKRQPKNKYDERAIEIFWKAYKIGYIKMDDNLVLANMLDDKINLDARIALIDRDKPDWEKIKVNVHLLV